MAGETDLHKLLKKEACRWLYRMGYRCIAAEVRLPPIGIVDAVGTGTFRANFNYLFVPQALHQTCFIECKASRADFLRDISEDGQLTLALGERAGAKRRKRRRSRRALCQRAGLGKFDGCLRHPLANLHYILAPAGMIQKKELPVRWGLLSYGEGGISVVVRPDWQEGARAFYVESAVARTLTMDIYRADDRAMASVNRQIMNQQAQLADRIRQMKIVMGDVPVGKCGGGAGGGAAVEDDVALGADAGPVMVTAPVQALPESPGRGIPTTKPALLFHKRKAKIPARRVI